MISEKSDLGTHSEDGLEYKSALKKFLVDKYRARQ